MSSNSEKSESLDKNDAMNSTHHISRHDKLRNPEMESVDDDDDDLNDSFAVDDDSDLMESAEKEEGEKSEGSKEAKS